jgi:hypothetical protein
MTHRLARTFKRDTRFFECGCPDFCATTRPVTTPHTMSSHQTSNVFTRLPADKVSKILAMAPSIAAANGCVLLSKDTTMKHIPLDGRLQPVVLNKADGAQLSSIGKYGGAHVLFKARCTKKFDSPQHVFRDGIEVPMVGTEKQTYYVEAIESDPDSVAAMAQLKALYDHADKSPVAWANAVASCPDHKALISIKGKKPSPEQIKKHAQQLVDRGSVFFPAARDEDDVLALKFCSKLRQDRRKYVRAKGTGFDIPIVDNFFAADSGAGLRLVSYLGRDGQPWKGKHEDIKAIHAGFFILTLYPDYYSDSSFAPSALRGPRPVCGRARWRAGCAHVRGCVVRDACVWLRRDQEVYDPAPPRDDRVPRRGHVHGRRCVVHDAQPAGAGGHAGVGGGSGAIVVADARVVYHRRHRHGIRWGRDAPGRYAGCRRRGGGLCTPPQARARRGRSTLTPCLSCQIDFKCNCEVHANSHSTSWKPLSGVRAERPLGPQVCTSASLR